MHQRSRSLTFQWMDEILHELSVQQFLIHKLNFLMLQLLSMLTSRYDASFIWCDAFVKRLICISTKIQNILQMFWLPGLIFESSLDASCFQMWIKTEVHIEKVLLYDRNGSIYLYEKSKQIFISNIPSL